MRTSSNLRLWMLPTLFAAVLLMPHAALAANSLGDMVMTAGEAMARPFAITIAMAAYLVGIAICISGLLKIVESAERGMTHDGAAIDGLMKIFFGSLLLVLPDIMGVGLYTLIQSDTGYVGSLSGTGVGAPQDCLGASASGAAGGAGSANIVTCVAQNLATNLVPIGIQVAFAMFYVVGLTMVFSVLVGLSKAHARGGRGLPEGWWVRLGIGFLSCNVPTLMGAIATSLGFTSPEITSGGPLGLTGNMTTPPSLLAYSAAGTANATLVQYQTLIGWCFVILVMFGVFSVWRGMLLLKGHAEGNKQASLGSAWTHIVGGVMLANGKVATCFIISTFFGGSGLGFC